MLIIIWNVSEPFIPNGRFYQYSLDLSISNLRVFDLLLGLLLIVEILAFNANSVDPDHTQNAASDLGLYCLQRFHLWDARLKRVRIR